MVTNDNYRPRSNPLAASFTSGGTTLTVTDATIFDIGDVIQVDSEYMLVTGTPDAGSSGTSSSMITVQPAYAGTTAASHTNGVPVYLVSNSRTGAEINVTSVSRIPQAVTQYCQTVQHAYQVGGALQADANYVTGFATPLDRDRMLAMQHVMDDFESAVYYGKGVQIAATATRPMMKGIGNLIQTNSVTAPINAAAYKPSDLVRDTLQACFNGGGNPTVLLVSTDFLSGFAVWGHAAMRLKAGSNVFVKLIELFSLRLRGLGPRGHAAERKGRTSSARRSTSSRPPSSPASRSSRLPCSGPVR